MAGLLNIGRSWSAVARSAYESLRDSLFARPEAGGVAPAPVAALRASAADSLRRAADALRGAFDQFATRMRPTYETVLYRGVSSSAMMKGTAARVERVDGYSVLATTVRVNTRTTTVRSSSSALGLDVVSPEAASVLASAHGLGLDVSSSEAVSTIQSTAEMNTGVVTSYGSSSLTFTSGGAASSSTGTLTGTYTGTGAAANATSLTFEITKGDTIGGLLGLGEGAIDFRVTDQTGAVLFTYSGSLGTNEQVYLGNDIGLTISFSSGQLEAGHTASTTVTKTPITVDANAAFNAAPASRPKFEGGAVVTAGSFTVNGVNVAVQADDTINTVLSRINASGAGVTASVTDDRLTIVSSGYSEDAIVLADDTSGFLAATKLSGATTATGNVRDDRQVLAKTSQFGSVASGSFSVNGVSITVDRNADSLESILGRINSAGAGVTAAFNASTNRIELTTTAASEDLIAVGSDTSGFLDAAGLSTGTTVRGNVADDEQVFSKAAQFAGVVDGSFTINGVSISVDAGEDSLQSVIDRVNASGAGVTASYDADADRLVFTPDVAGATLTIEDDTSGLLTAASIAEGTEATEADPDAAFNAAGAAGPHFDAGFSVQAGSFTVNGVTIAVAAGDTINSVLASIAASAAGVDAAYDADTQTVTLTSREFGADPIVVADDTSGFLAAVKLDGTANSTTGGGASPFALELGAMDEYDGVQAGTLTVNGHQIAIDPASTTLEDLVASLNRVENVTAVLDEQTGALTLNSHLGGSLAVSDTSGILAALGLSAGTVSGTVGATTVLETQVGREPSNTADVVSKIRAAADALNAEIASALAARPTDASSRSDFGDALQALVDALGREGVAGVTAASVGEGAPSIAVDVHALQRALNAISSPEAARTAMRQALNAFAEKAAEIAARPVPAAPAEPVRSMTVQLPSLPLIDPAVARSRAGVARGAGIGSRKALAAEQLTAPLRPDERPRTAGRITDAVVVTPPIDQASVFDSIIDRLLQRLL